MFATPIRSTLLTFLAAGLMVGSLQAQTPCATLTVQTGANHTVVFRVQDDPNALVGLVLGFQTGTTTIPLGTMGTLQLGVASPFDVQWIGNTNSGGQLIDVVQVPANLPLTNLVAQVFTVPTPLQTPLSFCTSNVVSFQVGT